MDVTDYLITSDPSFRRLLVGGNKAVLDNMREFKKRQEEEEDEF